MKRGRSPHQRAVIRKKWLREARVEFRERLAAYAEVEVILKAVQEVTGVSMTTLLGPDRTGPVSIVRSMAMYLARTETPLSLKEIGRVFDRDHTSVYAAHRNVEGWLPHERHLREQVEQVRQLMASVRQQDLTNLSEVKTDPEVAVQ